jgi:hypothetical protein
MIQALEEKIILEANTGGFLLTTRKVRFRAREVGRAKVISIMLEHITSCEIDRRSNPLYILLAIIALMGSIWYMEKSQESYWFVYGLVIATVFVIIYIMTQRQVLIIASPSAKIFLKTHKMPFDKCISVIDEIETAKDSRYHIGRD